VAPGGWATPAPQTPVVPAPTSGLAVAALVTAILGIPIAALPLGYIARNEIDRSQGRQGGRGMAVAAIVIGWIELAVVLVIIVFVIAVFVVVAPKAINEIGSQTTSQAHLRTAMRAAQIYYRDKGSFEGLTADKMAGIEPSLTFDDAATATRGVVSVRPAGSDQVVLVTSTDELGLPLCIAESERSGTVSFGMVDASTPGECVGGWLTLTASPSP
jgi:type II secretory pathway pseudopilin PulG